MRPLETLPRLPVPLMNTFSLLRDRSLSKKAQFQAGPTHPAKRRGWKKGRNQGRLRPEHCVRKNLKRGREGPMVATRATNP
jgi:hypothetical protein